MRSTDNCQVCLIMSSAESIGNVYGSVHADFRRVFSPGDFVEMSVNEQ